MNTYFKSNFKIKNYVKFILKKDLEYIFFFKILKVL